MEFKNMNYRKVLSDLYEICGDESEACSKRNGDSPEALATALHYAENALTCYDSGEITEEVLFQTVCYVVTLMVRYCFEYNCSIDDLFQLE